MEFRFISAQIVVVQSRRMEAVHICTVEYAGTHGAGVVVFNLTTYFTKCRQVEDFSVLV